MATKPSTAAPPPPTTTTTTSTANLTFEKKNTHLLHIPSKTSSDGNNANNKTYRIEKRPIPRAPIASPYAGSHVPKTVYISSKTPFMSAVKRVQKLLRLAERRAMAPLIKGKGRRLPYHQQQHGAGGGGVLEKCQQRLREEKVLVKATGRAIEKAVSVGRWFEEGKGGGGEEFEVVVRTGSVCVVDDIVEEDASLTHDEENEEEGEGEGEGSIDPDITMSMTTTTNTNSNTNTQQDSTQQDKEPGKEGEEGKEESKNQRRRRRKRERIRAQRLKAFVDEDGETPESRTRWVNMVEIAINMK